MKDCAHRPGARPAELSFVCPNCGSATRSATEFTPCGDIHGRPDELSGCVACVWCRELFFAFARNIAGSHGCGLSGYPAAEVAVVFGPSAGTPQPAHGSPG